MLPVTVQARHFVRRFNIPDLESVSHRLSRDRPAIGRELPCSDSIAIGQLTYLSALGDIPKRNFLSVRCRNYPLAIRRELAGAICVQMTDSLQQSSIIGVTYLDRAVGRPCYDPSSIRRQRAMLSFQHVVLECAALLAVGRVPQLDRITIGRNDIPPAAREAEIVHGPGMALGRSEFSAKPDFPQPDCFSGERSDSPPITGENTRRNRVLMRGDGCQFLTGLCIPDGHDPVDATAYDFRCVRREGAVHHLIPMPAEGTNLRSGHGIPQLQCFITCARGY